MTDINKDGLEVSSNGIIFNLKFHKNYSSDYTPKSKNDNKRFTNSKWYRSSQSVSYFLRDSACDKTSKDEAKLFNSLQ